MKKLFSLTIAIFFASVLFGQTASVIYSFSGDASDISGNGNDGTLSAGTSAINALKIANSVNNYLIVPADVLDGIADLSINFKIKFTGFHTTGLSPVSYTHLRAHETVLDLVCRLLLEKKKIPTPQCNTWL